MHIGKYIFAQITQFLPQRHFRRILTKYDDKNKGWSFSLWSHMLVLIFGQLMNASPYCLLRSIFIPNSTVICEVFCPMFPIMFHIDVKIAKDSRDTNQ